MPTETCEARVAAPIIWRLAIGLVVSATSACSILSGRCLYETRAVSTETVVTDNGAELVRIMLTEFEQRDYEPGKDMSWSIISEALFGHVTSIVLVDATAKTTVLYTFPLTNIEGQHLISNGAVAESQGANLNGFFDLLSRSRGMLIIRTDIPGKTVIEVPLEVRSTQDWFRPYCS